MKVMQKLKPVKSKIETRDQSSFMRNLKLINVFSSQRIGEIEKCLMKNVILNFA